MNHRLVTVALVCAAWLAPVRAARGQSPPIHPAVVRIMAAESGGASFGSGALVAVNERYGLVVTNWHVVRDTNGFVVVSFPDGFRSPATVVRTDRDWDLAALAVWRPRVEPVRLSAEAPRPGEWLTIAGYGKGKYRMASGRCTQYLSPGGRLPFEMVELATPAREGDSGGPIFNQRGELAGVLFGTGMGRTMGSYCGRVRAFLDPLVRQMEGMDGQPASHTMLAGPTLPVAAPSVEPPLSTPWSPPPASVAARPAPAQPADAVASRYGEPPPLEAKPSVGWAPPTEHVGWAPPTETQPKAQRTTTDNSQPTVERNLEGRGAQTVSLSSSTAAVVLDDRFAGIQAFLAIAGAVLLSLHAIRLLGRAVG